MYCQTNGFCLQTFYLSSSKWVLLAMLSLSTHILTLCLDIIHGNLLPYIGILIIYRLKKCKGTSQISALQQKKFPRRRPCLLIPVLLTVLFITTWCLLQCWRCKWTNIKSDFHSNYRSIIKGNINVYLHCFPFDSFGSRKISAVYFITAIVSRNL